MARNLEQILIALNSTKVKERTSGIELLSSLYEIPGRVEKLDTNDLLVLLTALFTAFSSERAAYMKKPSAAENRLKSVAKSLRTLVERTHRQWTKRVLRVALEHLFEHCKDKGELFDPIALDYFHIIAQILRFRPHADNLDDAKWVKLADLMFNVILGDSFRTRLEDTVDSSSRSPSPMEVDEDEEELSSPTKKRKWLESTPAPRAGRRVKGPGAEVGMIKPVASEILGSLLRNPSAPLLSAAFPFMPAAILNRMQRYLAMYSNKASLHRELLPSLSAVLSVCALDNPAPVARFAREAWPDLMDVWKIKDWREESVVVVRKLFPYLTVENPSLGPLPPFDASLRALYDALEKDTHDAKIKTLSLDCLRLQLLSDMDAPGAFVARTFRFGWKFNSTQALSWALFELHADCAAKLYHLSRSTLYTEGAGRKRVRREDPITELLSFIRTKPDVTLRVCHLQQLLFIIDRHWSIIHDELQQSVRSALLQFLSYDEPDVQSWTFMCLASVAHASSAGGAPAPWWDDVWTHATREVALPRVSRAACHVAHTLLTHARPLISANKIFSDIEGLAKDLVIQGPTSPSDSVCAFLVSCMRVASQDVRLYRLQLEEKVLSWLLKSWVPAHSVDRAKMPLHTVNDIHHLLEVICGARKQVDIISGIELPECAIVDTVVEEHATAIIRDYALFARLPPFTPVSDSRGPVTAEFSPATISGAAADVTETLPGGKERRLSNFFTVHLEKFAEEEDKEHKPWGRAVERIRVVLDFAVSALCFETTVLINGSTPNKRVVQLVTKVVGRHIAAATNPSINTWEDRLFILSALDPLVLVSPRNIFGEPWESMLPAGPASGIRKNVLRQLSTQTDLIAQRVFDARHAFQTQALATGVPEAFVNEVLNVMRNCLKDVSTSLPRPSNIKANNGLDDDTIHLSSDSMGPINPRSTTMRRVVDACIGTLAAFPSLRSGRPTRETEIFQIFKDCSAPSFLLFVTIFAEYIQEGAMHMNASSLLEVFEGVEDIAAYYECKSDDAFRIMGVTLLRATLHVWVDEAVDNVLLRQVGHLFNWVYTIGRKDLNISWRAADAVVRFLDEYLRKDPSEAQWPLSHGENAIAPHSWLHSFAGHADIRVRFRAVLASARSFSVIERLHVKPMDWYISIRNCIGNDTDRYELMITRLLCLGNIMLARSAVRRGAYWNLLELCFFTPVYTAHVETIVAAISQRLGLSVASFFGTYAGQVAIAMRVNNQDFLKIPPHLLGYQDRAEYVQAVFPLFTPPWLAVSGKDAVQEKRGFEFFTTHCDALKKTLSEGLEECLSDVVGQYIVYFIANNDGATRPGSKDLLASLKELFARVGRDGPLERQLRHHADGILAAIVRTLDEADYSPTGPIGEALEDFPEASVEVFSSLTKFRNDTFYQEEAIVPAWQPRPVIQALIWFEDLVPHYADDAATYHVLHHLFALLEQHPIIYEQLRLLNVICMWIACRHTHLQAPAILEALFNGALNVLAQSDLARGAQSVLDWIFGRLDQYRSSELNLRLSEGLLRIGCIGNEYAEDKDADVARMGEEIIHWIEDQLSSLRRIDGREAAVLEALAAWPRELNDSLRQLCGHIDADDISGYLRGENISTNKFRLVRRLHDLVAEGPVDTSHFAQSDFWKLKSCIPVNSPLALEDVHAFTELLIRNHGHIDGLEHDAPTSPAARTHHLKVTSKDSAYLAAQVGARKAVFVSLLNMLRDPSTPRAYLAFKAVRCLAAATTSDAVGTTSWPSGHTAELSYLKAYSNPPPSDSSSPLHEVLSADSSLELANEFSDWVCFVASSVCGSLAEAEPFYSPLLSALQKDARLAEEILPVLVHTILQRELARRTPKDTPAPIRQILSQYLTRVLASTSTAVSCRRVIVDVLLHLRQAKRNVDGDPLSHEQWLDIDFILLSQSAIAYGAYTTALLFTEFAAEFSPQSYQQNSVVEHVLYEIYSHIDEPDGFYGIKSRDPHGALLKRLHHENQWQKAFQFHGASIDGHFSEGSDVRGVLQAMHSFGFDQLALTTLQAVHGSGDVLSTGHMAYGLGWRTETWDLPERLGDDKAALYVALRAVHRERDAGVVKAVFEHALVEETARLRSLADENIAEIREVAQDLLCLNEIRHWRSDEVRSKLQAKALNAAQAPELANLDLDIEYPFFEALTATRVSLLHSTRHKEERDQIGDMRHPFVQSLVDLEVSYLLRLSQASRQAGNVQVALNSVVRAQKLCSEPRFDVSKEYAHVLWLSREPRPAVQCLSALLGTSAAGSAPSVDADVVTQASVYATLGTWAAEACLEKPAAIMDQYFKKAAELVHNTPATTSSKDGISPTSVLHQYAIFAELQYNSLVKSTDVLRRRVYVGRKEEELKQWDMKIRESEGSNLKEYQRYRKKAQMILDEDRGHLAEYDRQRDAFLREALSMYSRTLQSSDDFDDDSIIRFCSLWFANFDQEQEGFQDFIADVLSQIPSRKFVFLTHQLAARLSKTDQTSRTQDLTPQHNLYRVVLRMCKEHPFHTLYPVFCLQGDEDPNKSRRQSTRHEPTSSQAERVAAAVEIFQHLRADPVHAQRANDIDLVCRASLEWALYPIKREYDLARTTGKPVADQVPRRLRILAIKNVKVPPITAPLPIDVTGRYEDCVWIAGFESRYDTAGGVNVPKITNCIGSDGYRYKQLYKGEGNDDLRQDAVMEQVFSVVNMVLQHDRQTMRRKLRIRGYKVIPLSSQAGVLEFVENTRPLKHWLDSAHVRYRPQDIKPSYFSNELGTARKAQKEGDPRNSENMFKLYAKLRASFKPVMRHFFTENHKVPIVWFRTRLNYARSVATTSIVGHILGLGDRHPTNILQDTASGEVVHIDLGIAFEQGKLLPVPERVPFRLTPDMIDGFGTSGVDGVFRRCSEETLRVLREGQDVILTVLEVFKYDPLHAWTASEMKLKQAQSRTEATSELTEVAFKFVTGLDLTTGAAGEAADRALGSVQRKLDKANSVEFVVNDLIQQATDPFTVANMYHGWSPYL